MSKTPQNDTTSKDGGSVSWNLTIRDYFAAKAMQAMVSSYRTTFRGNKHPVSEKDADMTIPDRDQILGHRFRTGDYDGAIEVAHDAYKIADAMLMVRANT